MHQDVTIINNDTSQDISAIIFSENMNEFQCYFACCLFKNACQ